MTQEEIVNRLNNIRLLSDAQAHRAENNLWRDFIVYVASGPDDPDLTEKARLVLISQKIPFDRFYGERWGDC
jgi:hypothetical protein